MQIVIDIPDFIYNALKEDVDCGTVNLNQAIVAGTVLPKGHGDLISRSVLIDKVESLDRRYGSDFYWETRRIIDKVPVVIDADNEVG